MLLSLALGFAQSPQSQRAEPERQRVPTFRVQSNLVVVDVTVRDRQGNLVGDLGKEDFTIYEDNIPQEIVTFSLEKIPVAPSVTVAGKPESAPQPPIVNLQTVPPAQVKNEDLQDKRLVILFFDLSSLGTEELIRSVEAARAFVSNQGTAHDLIAVATYNSSLQLVQDLTNDRAVLLQTLKQISPTEVGDRPTEDLGDPDTSDEVYVPDDVQFNIFNTDRRLSALESLSKMYREFPERKALIYFSSGVTTTGIENDSQIRSTVDAANRSNMTVYTVDSRGLLALPPGGDATRGSAGGRAMFSGSAVQRQTADLSASQETLTTLAHDTGGVVFQDTNDLTPVFTKVLNDTRMYYVLGYYSTNQREDGRFRKVRVEVKRPELKLQHRPGYFASKQFTRLTQAERDRQLEEAFSVDRPFSEVPFILEADYFKTDGSTSLMPVTIQLAGDGVKFEVKGDRREAQFEFLAQITDPKGRVAGVARDMVQVRLPAQTAEKIRTGQILYTTGFQLRPGDYRLKFLVRDNQTGLLGTFEQALAVPALEGKSLETSSIVLGSRLVSAKESATGVEHQGFGRRFEMLGIKYDPLQIEDRRIVPSIGNVFRNRQTLYVYFQVYGAAENPQTRKPSLDASLMLLRDKSKVLGSQPQAIQEWTRGTRGTAIVAMALPLRNLPKAAYILQIHIRDAVSDTNLFKRVPLVIE
jgi:VWFA-related protein